MSVLPSSETEASAEIVEVDRDPTSKEERDFIFDRERQRAAALRNESDQQDMQERKRYADNAYGITQTWVGFIIVITLAQVSLKPLGLGLTTPEFIAVITTTTASVFGFWVLVGNYLFKPRPPDGRER